MSFNTGLEAPAELPISEADVAGFAAKLEAWYETLPPGEQEVLQRLLACAEGMVSEECEVAGYVLPGIGARLTRLFAAGLMAATLAAPMAASAALGSLGPVNTGLVLTDTHTPEEHIVAKAVALGASFTGAAVSRLETLPNGFRIRFQKCDIYYAASAGTHEVHGPIRDKYNFLGGPFGHFGLPRTDELVNSDGVGRHNEFAGDASIYFSPDTGPFAVEGQIRGLWVGQGAENSRFGYPTAEFQNASGGRWGDFQNDVIFLEGTTLRATENVEMSRAQLTKWLRGFLRTELSVLNSDVAPRDGLEINSFSISSVTNTGPDFSHSRNRLVTVHLEGKWVLFLDRDPTFTMDLHFLFFAQKETDGSTTLRVRLADYKYVVTHHGDRSGSASDVDGYIDGLLTGLKAPVKLIDVTIPAAVPVLSFKVMEDGRLKLFLQPGGGSPVVQLAVQLAFDRLAK